ncbi:YceD family protein [Hydrogenophaga sp.]|uniref:YceD family protein n=1 Tax=Hydrogenophaga sp. TaxID=1904254 RepID=UPI003F708BA8
MKPPSKSAWNPDRLDARAFAEARGHLQIDTPLTHLPRLRAEADGEEALPGDVRWEARGELRPGASGGSPSPWLHLEARTCLPLTCQRCLGPVDTPLEVDRWFRFVADEATAEAQDDDAEEDLLALEPRPSLFDVLEDELIMALPLVPLHESCPVSVVFKAGDPGVEEDEVPTRKNPFAALERLKKT